MKASWESKDLARMARWPMTFSAIDLKLIDDGLRRLNVLAVTAP